MITRWKCLELQDERLVRVNLNGKSNDHIVNKLNLIVTNTVSGIHGT